MNTQETLTKAMLNRKAISFQYSRLGKIHRAEITNAHVIFISNKLGKKTVTTDLSQNEGNLPGWKNFDISNMFNVQIVGDERAAAAM